MSQKFKSELELEALNNASTDTDKFLVSDNGIIKYRTGTELLNDINGQSLLTNPITGTGTINKLPKFTGSGTLGNSQIFDNGTNIGIGTTSPASKLHIVGDVYTSTGYIAAGNSYMNSIGNINSNNNANVSLTTSGVRITRNIADSNTVFAISNLNASSTGAVQTWNNSTGELMRITQNGNVGIGTSSPSAKLQIGTSGNTGALSVQSLLAGDNVITGRDYAGEEFFLVRGALDDDSMEINIGDYNDSYGLPYLKLNANTVIFNNTSIGVGTSTPEKSAILHLQSNTKGFLPPVMTDEQMNGIVSPAQGLMIFNTDIQRICVFDGNSWKALAWDL